ncbi:MAG: SDR family oxidoreductase [bacterium]|nr:SDR family oxidoreductase [bacterium]
MRILVTGATGFIGQHIVQALASEEHSLVLTSRTPHTGADGHDWRIIDFATAHRPDDWSDVVENVDLVINAVGIFKPTRRQSFEALHDKAPRALFAASKTAGVKRIIQISALGTDESATGPYHLSKQRADDTLATLEVEWVVLRPSLIIGGSGESWRFFKALASLPVTPVIGNGGQPLQPVAIEDVTRAVLASIQCPQATGHRINLVGAECVTLKSYLQALTNWLGHAKHRPLKIPYGLAGALAGGGALFADMPINRQAVTMLKGAREFVGDDCPSKLGFTPIGLSQFLAQNPASKEARSAASLYFLGPTLRIALAIMWIMAGVVSLFFFPVEKSLALLAKLGFTGSTGTIAFYGAVLLDIFIGLSLLMRFRIKQIAALQIGLIAVYTLALSWVAPMMWSDPFGPLAKNIPILVAILIMQNLED